MNEDTLAKLTLAAAAGLTAVVVGKKIYKKYKENEAVKKYTDDPQDNKHRDLNLNPYSTSLEPKDFLDMLGTRNLTNHKK